MEVAKKPALHSYKSIYQSGNRNFLDFKRSKKEPKIQKIETKSLDLTVISSKKC